MPDTPIDKLTIEIDAKASAANSAIDNLCKKIDILTTSISGVDVGKLNSLSSRIQRLGVAAKGMQSIDKRSFEGIATKIKGLSAIDTSKFAAVSADLHQMANGIQSLGTVSANVASVGELAKNISKLGNKSVQTAITNIPQLGTALNGLMATLSHTPKVSQNIIQMTNALANLTAQGSKVGSSSNGIASGLNRITSSTIKANKSFKGLASIFGRFYANCFLIIRGIKSLWSSINSTADYLEAYNYFDVALTKIGNDWASDYKNYGYKNAEIYADSFSMRLTEKLSGLSGLKLEVSSSGNTGFLTESNMKNLGLNIQEVTQYASQLASVTNSIGQTGEISLAVASAFTKLGADMSSLFNVSYSSVMNNLQSALIGQSRAVYKYGIDITNATLQTYAYELGVKKAVSEMSQMEKQQLRVIAILDQSKVAWGDQANTINSFSNSIRQFKNNISEVGQVLGQLFVPILTKVMPIINGVTIAIKRLLVSIAGIMGIELNLTDAGQSTNDYSFGLDEISDSFNSVSDSAKKAKNGIRGFDELNVINTPSDTGSGNSGSGVGGGIDLTDNVLDAIEEYEKAWQEAYDNMINEAEAFADKISTALEPVKKIFQDFAIGDFFQAGQDVSNLVVSIMDFFAKAIDSVDWYGIGTKIGNFLAGINWLEIFASIGNLIWQAIKASIEQWSGMYDAAPIETAIITGIALLKFTGVGSLIVDKIKKRILEKLGEITSIFTTGGIFNNIGLVIENLFSGLSLKASLTGVFGELGTKIIEIGTIIAGVTMAVTNFFSMWENGFNWFKEAVMLVGIALTSVGAIILGAPALVTGVIAGIVAVVATVAIAVHDNWDSICDFSKELWEKVSGFFSNLWNDVVEIWNNATSWFSEMVTEPIVTLFETLKTKVSIFFTTLWNTIKSIWSNVSSWFSETVIEPIINFFQGLWTRVKQIFEGLWIIVQAIWKIVSDWFNENVIIPIINLFEKIYHNVSNFFKKLWENIEKIWSTVSNWFNRNVIKPVTNFFKKLWDNVSEYFENLWNEIKNIWENVSSWFNVHIIHPVSNAFETACKKIGSFFDNLWDGLKKGVASAMNVVINVIENGLNWLVDGINGIISGFNRVVSWAASIIEVNWSGVALVPKISLGRIDVSGYEVGGFPKQYSLFMAGEHGTAEILGTVGGKTAVAGGAEITGIRDEIRATSNEEMALLKQQNALLQAILEKEYGISKDDIGKAAQSWARDYTRRTGREAYNF